jgi:hypothetical protein
MWTAATLGLSILRSVLALSRLEGGKPETPRRPRSLALQKLRELPCPQAGGSLIAVPSFPVPGSREIPPKVAGNQSPSRRVSMSPESTEFPVFSLLNWIPRPETGSHWTAPTAT